MSLRAVRAGFLLLAGLIVGGVPVSEERPKWVLQSLATDDPGFRACDRDWNQVNPFWTAESEPDSSD